MSHHHRYRETEEGQRQQSSSSVSTTEQSSSSSPPPSSSHDDDERYLAQLEYAVCHASSPGYYADSRESSIALDAERDRRADGMSGACLELLRRRGWGGGRAGRDDGDCRRRRMRRTATRRREGEEEEEEDVMAAASSSSSSSSVVARHDAVSFYALATIQRSPLFSSSPPPRPHHPSSSSSSPPSSEYYDPSPGRCDLRALLLGTISDVRGLRSMPKFVVTKVAVLLALIVREDYPASWTDPLGDVLDALGLPSSSPSPPPPPPPSTTTVFHHHHHNHDGDGCASSSGGAAAVGMYLSFLDAISDEIAEHPPAVAENDEDDDDATGRGGVSERRRRREGAKDALRGHHAGAAPPGRTDAARIAGWLLDAMLAGIAPPRGDGGDDDATAISVAARSAATLGRYLSWADLRIATDRNLIRTLLDGLGGASPGRRSCCDDDDDEEPTPNTMFAVECANCLRVIVERGMDEREKGVLLTAIGILGSLCERSSPLPPPPPTAAPSGCTHRDDDDDG